jgi:hypothetical protein
MVIIGAHVDKVITVQDWHDMKTWLRQYHKRERPGAPPPLGNTLQVGPGSEVGTLRGMQASCYLKTRTRSQGKAGR